MKKGKQQSYSSLLLALLFAIGALAVTLTVVRHVKEMEATLANDGVLPAGNLALNKDTYDALEKYWVEKEEAPQFVSLLESSAASTGVALEILSLRYEKVERNEYLVADLSFGGDWGAMIRFMRSLSLLPHEKSVQNVQVAQTLDASQSWHGSVLLKVRTFER